MEFFEDRASEAELRRHVVNMTGVGAGAPTKNYGQGITITRVAQGRVRLTWAENPGIYVGVISKSLDAHTQGNVKQWSVVAGDWDNVNYALEVDLFDGAGAAVDLAAQEYLTLTIGFKAISV